MTNVIRFELVKVAPQTELAIEKGEYRIRNKFGEVVPACKLSIVVKDMTKAKLILQGNDTIINGKGFYISGENKLTLDCYNNKQVDNLVNYYRKVFSL
jgi:hypothetical protein